ncbi:hypothetical protein GGS24DRAFT_457644 [Hypoxylon argillaceum]|nr:hypothetical protein GGS24DRAFT_457644 [Hypoxylon argillaceum]
MYAPPFFVHPYAQGRGNYGFSAEQTRRQSSEAVVDGPSLRARRYQQTSGVRKMMAEMKVSLAVNQLSDQVKESKQFWKEFRDEYLAEVNSIKLYVGADVLQQIWRKKVAFNNNKDKLGDKGDNQQFAIQSMKLESCLNQVDEATQLLAEVWSSGYSSDYDSQQHHLAKIRGAGNMVVGLSKRSVANEAACTDLMGELAELEKFIDSKSTTGGMPHGIAKGQSQYATGVEGGDPEGLDSTGGHGDYGEEDNPNPNGWAE